MSTRTRLHLHSALVIWDLPISAVSTLCWLFNYFNFPFKITIIERFSFSLHLLWYILFYQSWKQPAIPNAHKTQGALGICTDSRSHSNDPLCQGVVLSSREDHLTPRTCSMISVYLPFHLLGRARRIYRVDSSYTMYWRSERTLYLGRPIAPQALTTLCVSLSRNSYL